MAIKGRICDVDGNGEILHIELTTEAGETVVGVYELIGWTKPPKDVKQKAELELWVPPKAGHSVN